MGPGFNFGPAGPPGKGDPLLRTLGEVSRSAMSPRARRAWAIGLIVFFVVMCAAIAVSQWWAVHKNVPYYESQKHARSV